jgi:hypothetical protein
MTTTQTSDHRRMKRRQTKKTVTAQLYKGTLGLGPNLALRTCDVSVDGIQLFVKSPLAAGDDVQIVLLINGISGNVARDAKVMWCTSSSPKEHRIGVKFRQPLSYEHVFHMT